MTISCSTYKILFAGCASTGMVFLKGPGERAVDHAVHTERPTILMLLGIQFQQRRTALSYGTEFGDDKVGRGRCNVPRPFW